MNRILYLENPIQEYPWGSRRAIAELLGRETPSSVPQAELWMGAHPKAPSRILQADGCKVSLETVIAQNPVEILGRNIADKFGNRLPYLFKVLAAEHPLSIQAHPNRQQAREGFARENQSGIALGTPNRNYKDDNHKPECLCALTPFWALCGFRDISEMISLFEQLAAPHLLPYLKILQEQPNDAGLKHFFHQLMSMPAEIAEVVYDETMTLARPWADVNPIFLWIRKLGQAYPKDIGVLSPIFLNLVQLQPGAALFLPAGVLHAYLNGIGVELMANSDNVLRGGLTPKHVDIPELLNTLTFRPARLSVIQAEPMRPAERAYRTPAEEFLLSVVNIEADKPYLSPEQHSADILLCTEGDAIIQCPTHADYPIRKGDSVLAPASLNQYQIHGNAVLYKASVP